MEWFYSIVSISFLVSTLSVCSWTVSKDKGNKPIVILIICWIFIYLVLTMLHIAGFINMKQMIVAFEYIFDNQRS
jgi:hypothetical protein